MDESVLTYHSQVKKRKGNANLVYILKNKFEGFLGLQMCQYVLAISLSLYVKYSPEKKMIPRFLMQQIQ